MKLQILNQRGCKSILNIRHNADSYMSERCSICKLPLGKPYNLIVFNGGRYPEISERRIRYCQTCQHLLADEIKDMLKEFNYEDT